MPKLSWIEAFEAAQLADTRLGAGMEPEASREDGPEGDEQGEERDVSPGDVSPAGRCRAGWQEATGSITCPKLSRLRHL